jgi:hypothetical protein
LKIHIAKLSPFELEKVMFFCAVRLALLSLLIAVLLALKTDQLLAQEPADKSAPNEKNTDLQFDFAVTNSGKLGTYRIVRLDTGETLATGLVGKDVSSRTTLMNEFKAAGIPARTPVSIQVKAADGSWSPVDRIDVHYPAEPSDSQRYLDDAGYRGTFRVPDLAASSPTPAPKPEIAPSATPSPFVSPSPRASAAKQGGSK